MASYAIDHATDGSTTDVAVAALSGVAGLTVGVGVAVLVGLAYRRGVVGDGLVRAAGPVVAVLPAIYIAGWILSLYEPAASVLLFLGAAPGGAASAPGAGRCSLRLALAVLAASSITVLTVGLVLDRLGDEGGLAVIGAAAVLVVATILAVAGYGCGRRAQRNRAFVQRSAA